MQPDRDSQAAYEGSIPFARSSLRLLRKLRLAEPSRGEGCRGVARRVAPDATSTKQAPVWQADRRERGRA